MDASEPHGSVDSELDQIIAALDGDDGELPVEAIRAAQRRREEITPRLIDLIRRATATVQEGRELKGDGHYFSLFLLTEFGAREALPAIVEAISLPGEGPFELFGDSVHDDLSRVLASLAHDRLEVIDNLIDGRSVDRQVRWEAAHTYIYLVRDGRLSRAVAVERLCRRLEVACAQQDLDGATLIVSELLGYAPREGLDLINKAFDLELIDDEIVEREAVDRNINDGNREFLRELIDCPPTGFSDTVEELNWWAANSYDVYEDELDDGDDEWDVELSTAEQIRPIDEILGGQSQRESTTIHNTQPRTGRNEPCPCGSGKKFKKCCGGK